MHVKVIIIVSHLELTVVEEFLENVSSSSATGSAQTAVWFSLGAVFSAVRRLGTTPGHQGT